MRINKPRMAAPNANMSGVGGRTPVRGTPTLSLKAASTPRPDIKSKIAGIAKSAMGMGKTKKFAEGGLAGLADSAESLMGDVDAMANTINYGAQTPTSSTGSIGFNAINSFKKGGSVSSASKRADGCAVRGKTRA